MFDLIIAKKTSLCHRKTALHDNNEKRLLPSKGLRLLGGSSWSKTRRGWSSFHSLAPHIHPRRARSDPDGSSGPTQPCATTPRTTWTQTWNCKEAFQTTGDNIDKALSTFLYIWPQVCVTTDENGVETKTNLVKPSPSSLSTSSQTSSHFETRAKVKRPESDPVCEEIFWHFCPQDLLETIRSKYSDLCSAYVIVTTK